VDEPRKLGTSEYDDDDLGWAGRGDLGASKGRVLSGGERAALLRREAREAMEQVYPPYEPPDDEPI
jgi:hypothetical protein